MSKVLNAATGFGLLSHQESPSHLVTVVLVAEGRLWSPFVVPYRG